jgi:hypothetical protein
MTVTQCADAIQMRDVTTQIEEMQTPEVIRSPRFMTILFMHQLFVENLRDYGMVGPENLMGRGDRFSGREGCARPRDHFLAFKRVVRGQFHR